MGVDAAVGRIVGLSHECEVSRCVLAARDGGRGPLTGSSEQAEGDEPECPSWIVGQLFEDLGLLAGGETLMNFPPGPAPDGLEEADAITSRCLLRGRSQTVWRIRTERHLLTLI